MSWLQQLYETYELCVQDEDLSGPEIKKDGSEILGLLPMSHVSQQAHICIEINGDGRFLRAELLPPKKSFIIPATEESASRTSGPVPHPLADKIHYCAQDYCSKKENRYLLYYNQLKAWCDSPYSHPKALAVEKYVSAGSVVRDLVQARILLADEAGNLLASAPPEYKDVDHIFKRTISDQGDAFIVWRVILPGDMTPDTWRDESLQQAWIAYDTEQMAQKGLCMLQGQERAITTKHPRNIRRPGDGAKLVSSNDSSGFTFRGRLIEPEEALTIGYEASNKAHSALRWLIARQGYRNQDQAIVAWATDGASPPHPCDELFDPFPAEDEEASLIQNNLTFLSDSEDTNLVAHADAGQFFARNLRKALQGYRAELENSKNITILAFDSASPGRLSVTFYRSQLPAEYLAKLEAWQEDFAWILPWRGKEDKKTRYGVFAPTPKDLAKVAYGQRIDDKLLKATIERLLPCIVDGSPLPFDIVENCYCHACQRAALEKWEWPMVLGVACAVYKGYYARHPKITERRTYTMSLDEGRTTRDYLYGRLLAVAEYIERKALGEEKRPTNAERLFTRFADRPFSTWRTIEMQLSPYMRHLQNSNYGLFVKGNKWLQAICDTFAPEDFNNDAKLTGEFLLGYHCQLSALYAPKNKEEGDDHEQLEPQN